MICPHCTTGVKLPVSDSSIVHLASHPTEKPWGFDIAHGFCPECNGLVVLIRHGTYWQQDYGDEASRELYPQREEIIYPHRRRAKPLPAEVTGRYRSDFLEAFACLDISPKASAAVSRRLLQDMFQNEFSIQARNLVGEIDLFLQRNDLPRTLADQIDAVRTVGNFAAHPLKDTQTGEVLDVEPGEAEWLLDTLESLFDYAFVQPKRLSEQRAKLNAKLAAAGKPPLK
jgi:hypothetical protein